jgi:hypothetical protein
VPSRARLLLGVGGQLPVDHVGQAAQAAHRFHGGLPLGDPAAVVGAAGGVVAELDDAGHVEHVVEAAVTAPRQPVMGVLAGGSVDGGRCRSRRRSATGKIIVPLTCPLTTVKSGAGRHHRIHELAGQTS